MDIRKVQDDVISHTNSHSTKRLRVTTRAGTFMMPRRCTASLDPAENHMLGLTCVLRWSMRWTNLALEGTCFPKESRFQHQNPGIFKASLSQNIAEQRKSQTQQLRQEGITLPPFPQMPITAVFVYPRLLGTSQIQCLS